MAATKPSPRFQVGDRVAIYYSDWRGRIVEFRGPLAPGGVFVYRVRVPLKPKPTYIELREDQLEALPIPPKTPPSRHANQVPEAPGQPGENPASPKVKRSPLGKKRVRDEQKGKGQPAGG